MHFSVWPGCFDACQKPFDVTLLCDKTPILILLSVDSFKGQVISNQTPQCRTFHTNALSFKDLQKRCDVFSTCIFSSKTILSCACHFYEELLLGEGILSRISPKEDVLHPKLSTQIGALACLCFIFSPE